MLYRIHASNYCPIGLAECTEDCNVRRRSVPAYLEATDTRSSGELTVVVVMIGKTLISVMNEKAIIIQTTGDRFNSCLY